MEPTLKPGDKVLVEEGYYKSKPVLRGDLIALKFKSRNHPMVKRVVTVEGGTVKIKQGNLWVNGSPSRDKAIAQSKLKVLGIQLSSFNH